MSESILQEALAENAELRRKLAELERRLESINGFHSNIHILSDKPMIITGVLISEGVWKGIKYDYNELKKSLDKFKDLPVKVMHGKSEEFGNKIVGKVIQLGTDDLLKAITFKAEITDERAQQLIRDGTFNAVSIAGTFKELTNDVPPVGLGYEPIEVSLTGSPACSNCYIFSIEELSRSFGTKDLSKETEKRTVGEIGMSETNEPVENVSQEQKSATDIVEIKENQVLVTPDNFDQLSDGSEFEFQVVNVDNLTQELAKKKEEKATVKKIVIKVPAGKYPSVALKGIKQAGTAYPMYPYYYGYPTYYYYGYYGYPYYGYPTYYYYYYGYPSLEELLDVLELAESYRTFMKKCLKEKGGGPEALKACAAEWKKQQKAEEEQKPKEEVQLENKEEVKEMEKKEEPKIEAKQELAKIKCPVCGQQFDTKKAFLKHWKELHEEQYGAYKLIKRLILQEGLIPTFKHVIELAGEEEEEEEKKEVPKKLTAEEVAELILKETKK
jgi:uncharacterized C2H2 Zn-finger protein